MNIHEASESKDGGKHTLLTARADYFDGMPLKPRTENPLPPLTTNEEEAIAEALRRDKEMSSDPTIGISLKDFDRRIRRRL